MQGKVGTGCKVTALLVDGRLVERGSTTNFKSTLLGAEKAGKITVKAKCILHLN